MPSAQNYVFAIKAFGAALLALYIAFSIGLPRPSWAMASVFIVSQPFAGMVMSKAIYRIGGTLIGAFAAGFILIGFADLPNLQVLALASWVGLCVYLSCLDRTPRGYAFMLSGYTAAIIGFPSVEVPLTIFDTALARSEEISLGILCATLVHAVILPQRVGPVLKANLDGWFADASGWIEDMLIRTTEAERMEGDHRRLIADNAALERLRIHALYDSPDFKAAAGSFARLQERMQAIVSFLLAIEDRLHILRAERPDLLADLSTLQAPFAAWFRSAAPSAHDAAELRASLARIAPSAEAMRQDRHVLLLAALLQRLDDLVAAWEESLALRADIAAGRSAGKIASTREFHADHLMAALAGLTAMIVIVLICAFWIGTAWPEGALAAMMAAVACSLGASLDDPATFVLNFLIGTAVGIVIAGVYLFAILPTISGFAMLALVLAPLFIALAAFAAMPAYFPMALPVLLGVSTMLGLENRMSFDFASFANAAIAQLVAMAAAAAALRVARASGVQYAIERIVALIHRDLARLARGDRALTRARFESRMFDRVDGLLQRRAGGGEALERTIDGALAALRFGLNLRLLREQADALPKGSGRALGRVFAAVVLHFAPANSDREKSLARLEAALTEAIAAASEIDTERASAILIVLGQLRHIMTQHKAFFTAAPARTQSSARFWNSLQFWKRRDEAIS